METLEQGRGTLELTHLRRAVLRLRALRPARAGHPALRPARAGQVPVLLPALQAVRPDLLLQALLLRARFLHHPAAVRAHQAAFRVLPVLVPRAVRPAQVSQALHLLRALCRPAHRQAADHPAPLQAAKARLQAAGRARLRAALLKAPLRARQAHFLDLKSSILARM